MVSLPQELVGRWGCGALRSYSTPSESDSEALHTANGHSVGSTHGCQSHVVISPKANMPTKVAPDVCTGFWSTQDM